MIHPEAILFSSCEPIKLELCTSKIQWGDTPIPKGRTREEGGGDGSHTSLKFSKANSISSLPPRPTGVGVLPPQLWGGVGQPYPCSSLQGWPCPWCTRRGPHTLTQRKNQPCPLVLWWVAALNLNSLWVISPFSWQVKHVHSQIILWSYPVKSLKSDGLPSFCPICLVFSPSW